MAAWLFGFWFFNFYFLVHTRILLNRHWRYFRYFLVSTIDIETLGITVPRTHRGYHVDNLWWVPISASKTILYLNNNNNSTISITVLSCV